MIIYEKTNNRRSVKFWWKHPYDMPIDCSKLQICGVYRIFFIWEFAGGKSKFAHAFLEALKKFFLAAPWRKPPTCGAQTFFLSLLIRLRLSMAVFRISISIIVFVLLKEKYYSFLISRSASGEKLKKVIIAFWNV